MKLASISNIINGERKLETCIIQKHTRTNNCSSTIIPNRILDKKQVIGFIMTRHVTSLETDKYWKLSYSHIRKYYPENTIVIIDDNSNSMYLDKSYETELYKTIIINSEYPRRGELLPYIYYIKNRWFDTAVIIHDSVFINKKIDFRVKNYKMLWSSKAKSYTEDGDIVTKKLQNSEKLSRFRQYRNEWISCFGGMTSITHDFLLQLHHKYNFFIFIHLVKTRRERIVFEHVLGCMLNAHNKHDVIAGEMGTYCLYGTSFKDIDTLRHLPIIKVWTGR